MSHKLPSCWYLLQTATCFVAPSFVKLHAQRTHCLRLLLPSLLGEPLAAAAACNNIQQQVSHCIAAVSLTRTPCAKNTTQRTG